jgi:hypothetical protein
MAEKKPFMLRLSPELLAALQRIAEEEFRSVNGQIEFVLNDYVRKRGRKIDDPPEGRETES